MNRQSAMKFEPIGGTSSILRFYLFIIGGHSRDAYLALLATFRDLPPSLIWELWKMRYNFTITFFMIAKK